MENVRLAVQAREQGRAAAGAGRGLDLFKVWLDRKAWIDEAQALLRQVQLGDKTDAHAAALPHGDQRKLEVALLMALDPKVYMFDEPTAGMSVDDVPVILDLIRALKRATTAPSCSSSTDGRRARAVGPHRRAAQRAPGGRRRTGRGDRQPRRQQAYLGMAAEEPAWSAVLQLQGVHTHIGAYHILHGVDLEVPEGEVTHVPGRNGAGKSTTLRTIMGLYGASQGSITFRGQPTPRPRDARHRTPGHRLGARDATGIFTDLTADKSVAARAARHAGELDRARLMDGQGSGSTRGKLSGGQKQMPAVARAIVEGGAISHRRAEQGPGAEHRQQPDRRAARAEGARTTILLVEQNFQMARALGDTVAVMVPTAASCTAAAWPHWPTTRRCSTGGRACPWEPTHDDIRRGHAGRRRRGGAQGQLRLAPDPLVGAVMALAVPPSAAPAAGSR